MDQPASLESAIGDLASRLDAVERRLSALEATPPTADALHKAVPAQQEAVEASLGTTNPWAESLPLGGRTLMVLAGAFLLRALTEAGVLPPLPGAALGLAYALVWIALADRTAAAGKSTSATMFGLAGALIAYPLLWEATVKFGILSPPASALALIVVTVPGLFVASRQRLRSMAWMIAMSALVTTLALAVGTNRVVLFAGGVLLLGGLTLWIGFVRSWRPLGFVVAIAADANVILLTGIALIGDASRVQRILQVQSLVWLQLSLIVVYLGSFAIRTVARGRNARAPEISQGIAALLIGLLGAIAVTRSTSLSSLPLVIVSLLLAAGCYGASFTLTGTSIGKRRNFLFYTTIGLVSGLVACLALPNEQVRVPALGIAGLVTAALGAYRGRVTLAVHGAVFVVAATLISGLLPASVAALIRGVPSLTEFHSLTIVALLVAALFCWIPSKRHGRSWGSFAQVPKAVVLAIVALGAAAVAVAFASRGLTTIDGATPDPATLAALRTAAFAACVIGLAWLGRSERFMEASLLVYPFLIAGGVKLMLEDLRAGRPATLVISLALYGGAMIIAPRLQRSRKGRAP